jgi:acetoin utilization protein AcuB
MKQLVGDWMTKHPLRIDVNEDVQTARDIMRDEIIRHLLVTDQGELIGVLSQRDLESIEKIKSRFQAVDDINVKITVGDLMGRHPVSISEKATVAEAVRIMSEKHIHALPVKGDYGKVKGILTATDVMRYALVASQHMEINAPYSRIMKGL